MARMDWELLLKSAWDGIDAANGAENPDEALQYLGPALTALAHVVEACAKEVLPMQPDSDIGLP